MSKVGKIETLTTVKELSKELSSALRSLAFLDNFNSYTVDLTLIASEEKNNIRNELTVIPGSYIILFQTGNGLVTAGDTIWNKDYLAFKNHGSNTVTVKILILA